MDHGHLAANVIDADLCDSEQSIENIKAIEIRC